MHEYRTSRRHALQWLGSCALPLLTRPAFADDLPLHTTGLEHFGFTVPDPEATARFYGRIFDGQLFQEKDPPPRFYVKLGTGYAAFGGNPSATPSIDHFCALVENYQPPEMRKSLEAAGVTMSQGAFGMALDPDGLRLQLLRVPGGLAKTIIPAFRLSQDDALFQAIAFDHVMLHVSDLGSLSGALSKDLRAGGFANEKARSDMVRRRPNQAGAGTRGGAGKAQYSSRLRAGGWVREEGRNGKAKTRGHRVYNRRRGFPSFPRPQRDHHGTER